MCSASLSPGARSDPAPKIDPGPTLPPSQYPNDPDFAQCETQDPVTGCTDNEQWNLYGRLTGNTCLAPGGSVPNQPHPDGGLPCWARNAHDPGHAAGVNITGAWAQGNLGRADVVIAYIEGGVNYSSNGIKDGLDNIYLNRGELPYPERSERPGRGALRPRPKRALRHPRLRARPPCEPSMPDRHRARSRAMRRARRGAAWRTASTPT